MFFLTAQGRAPAGHDGPDAGHLPRAARCRVSGEMLVMPPIVDSAGRIVRGDRAPQAGVAGGVRGHVVRATLRQAQGRPEQVEGRQLGRDDASAVAVTIALVLTLGSSSPLAYLKLGAIAQRPRHRRDVAAAADRLFHLRSRRATASPPTDLRGAVERAAATWSARRIRDGALRVPGHDVGAGGRASTAATRSAFSIGPISIACSARPAS